MLQAVHRRLCDAFKDLKYLTANFPFPFGYARCRRVPGFKVLIVRDQPGRRATACLMFQDCQEESCAFGVWLSSTFQSELVERFFRCVASRGGHRSSAWLDSLSRAVLFFSCKVGASAYLYEFRCPRRGCRLFFEAFQVLREGEGCWFCVFPSSHPAESLQSRGGSVFC